MAVKTQVYDGGSAVSGILTMFDTMASNFGIGQPEKPTVFASAGNIICVIEDTEYAAGRG